MLHAGRACPPSSSKLRPTVSEVVVPGRMERVHEAAPLAVVDYSHTPDALDKVLGGLSDSGAPLVVVVGRRGRPRHDEAARDGSGRRAACGCGDHH